MSTTFNIFLTYIRFNTKMLNDEMKSVYTEYLVYDSVSRMSRNADEGCQLYENLFNKGVELVFLKENHINTSVYREALAKQIDISVNTGDNATDNLMNSIIEALNRFQMELAKKQIELAFIFVICIT